MDLALAVRPLAFEAQIRKLDVVIDHGQLVFTRPPGNLLSPSLRASATVPTTSVRRLEKRLILALQLLLEDDPPHTHTAFAKLAGGIAVGPVHSHVVRQFARLGDAGVELLPTNADRAETAPAPGAHAPSG